MNVRHDGPTPSGFASEAQARLDDPGATKVLSTAGATKAAPTDPARIHINIAAGLATGSFEDPFVPFENVRRLVGPNDMAITLSGGGGTTAKPNEPAAKGWYLWRSFKQVVFGDFNDDTPILLGTGTQVFTGFFGADFSADIRNISASVINWEWSRSHVINTLMNIAALAPGVGAFKYADEAAAVLRNAGKTTEASKVSKIVEPSRQLPGPHPMKQLPAPEGVRVLGRLPKGFDPAKGFASFKDFKDVFGEAGPGQAWHHIVEQTINSGRFAEELLHNPANLLRLPHGKGTIHSKISGFYSSKQPFTGG